MRPLGQLSDEARDSVAARFAVQHKTLEECGAVLRQTLEHLQANGFHSHCTVCNACLFLNTVDYDLSILISDVACERDEWRRRFAARSLALVLYEISEDIPVVFGKPFRDSLVVLGGAPAFLASDLNRQLKRVSQFWGANRLMLKEIRSAAAAHRDHDAIRMLDTIDGLDLVELINLGLEFGNVINDLGAAAQAVLTYVANQPPPEIVAGSS